MQVNLTYSVKCMSIETKQEGILAIIKPCFQRLWLSDYDFHLRPSFQMGLLMYYRYWCSCQHHNIWSDANACFVPLFKCNLNEITFYLVHGDDRVVDMNIFRLPFRCISHNKMVMLVSSYSTPARRFWTSACVFVSLCGKKMLPRYSSLACGAV